MKSIEYCLDTTLRKLKENYALNPRPELKSNDLLNDFEVPQLRDEFFKGIINILINDGYVDFLDTFQDRKQMSMENYRERPIILPKGLYFIEKGGYTNQKSKEWWKTFAIKLNAIVLFLGSLAAITYSLVEIANHVSSKQFLKEQQCKQDTLCNKIHKTLLYKTRLIDTTGINPKNDK